MSELQIIHSNDPSVIRHLRDEGFTPVECSIGGLSIVNHLNMDHHGDLSHLDGVALRAYNEEFGTCADRPRFVVTGSADADACFAIASLAGILPHPKRESELQDMPGPVRKALVHDYGSLADLINRVDTAPIGIDLDQEYYGPTLLLWNQLTGSMPQDAIAFYTGVGLWVRLLAGRPLPSLLQSVRQEEADRVKAAELDAAHRGKPVGEHVLLLSGSKTWGFDVWYRERPLVVALTEMGNVTVGAKDDDTARRLLGPQGLRSLFNELNDMGQCGGGWGGREAIGGSPRGVKVTAEEATEVAEILGGMAGAHLAGEEA